MTRKTGLPGSRPAGVRDEKEAARAVREMFTRIAPRYDLLNRLLSLTLDRAWRRRTATRLASRLRHPGGRALDLCCGTGDLALALSRHAQSPVVGGDFSRTMLMRARKKSGSRGARLLLVESDALAMPFADAQFNVITAAFGFRNLVNYRQGLTEIHRLLKPGGRVAILDFSLPRGGLFGALYRFYFRSVLPRIGKMVSGVPGPYTYLPASVESFPSCEELVRWMEETGFTSISYELWTGGVVALHQGVKAPGRADLLCN